MKRAFIVLGLLALVAIDVILVGLALRPPARPVSEGLGPPTPVVTTTTAVPAPTTASTPTTKPSQYTPAPLTVMIVALDRKHAWRATAGSCTGGGGHVQTTSDGGRTWGKGSEPARAIVRVQPRSATRGFAYGADDQCDLSEYVTDDAAKSWRAPRPATGVWSRQPKDASVVVTPADANARPCGSGDVLDLARAAAKHAYALCASGTMKETKDAGATWSDAGTVPGGLALGVGQHVYGVRGAGADCPGLEVVQLTGKADLVAVGCIAGSGPAEPGAVALSVTDGGGWIAVGEETWTSPDLMTWTKA